MQKIGITGSNNTGKTTLCHETTAALKRKNYRAGMRDESVRSCPIGTKANATIEAQKWILAAQMQLEEVIGYHEDIVLCDKTAVDTYCYGQFVFERNPTPENRYNLDILKRLVLIHTGTYDHLILVPVNPGIESKEWHPGVDHRAIVDDYVRRFLKEEEIPFIELNAPLG